MVSFSLHIICEVQNKLWTNRNVRSKSQCVMKNETGRYSSPLDTALLVRPTNICDRVNFLTLINIVNSESLKGKLVN